MKETRDINSPGDDSPDPMPRRAFMQHTAALIAAAQLGLSGLAAEAQAQGAGAGGRRGRGARGAAAATPTPIPTPIDYTPPAAPPDNLVGVQMGAHTMLDEGVEHAMDLCMEAGAINTLIVYSHSYGGDVRKPIAWLATDHGVPVKDQQSRNLPNVWLHHHEQYFKDTTLRHPTIDDSYAYHDRDVFKEMVEPARKRGMKIYARILEAGTRQITNFSKVTTVAADGRRTGTGCWNHPEYKAFWNDTVEDMFRSYDLDGFQWGAERQGPLMNMLINNNPAAVATCFCEFCVARGKAAGIDSERAKKGFSDVAAYVGGVRAGTAAHNDGALAGFLRILFRYPEVLAWEYQYRLSREEIMKGMYDTIKKVKPSAPVGWHVDHWNTSMDALYRAEMSNAEVAPWSDYLKVVMYHAALGPRMLSYLTAMHRGIMGDVPLEELFNINYDLLGYDKATEPTARTAATTGFSSEYVYRETKHSIASLAGAGNPSGKTKIYPGIAFNLPQGPADDPETVYQCVIKAYQAGANGVVASREYEEMTVPNLKGFGKAVRELKKA